MWRITMLFIGIAGAFIALTASDGFAASNTISDLNIGEGETVISGIAVTELHYTLDARNPSRISAVAFDIAGVDSSALRSLAVRIQLQPDGAWYPCAALDAGSRQMHCPTTSPGISVAAATQVRVVAAQ